MERNCLMLLNHLRPMARLQGRNSFLMSDCEWTVFMLQIVLGSVFKLFVENYVIVEPSVLFFSSGEKKKLIPKKKEPAVNLPSKTDKAEKE